MEAHSKWNADLLKDRVDLDRELFTAALLAAFAQAKAGLAEIVVLGIGRSAMRTNRGDRPNLAFEVSECGGFIV